MRFPLLCFLFLFGIKEGCCRIPDSTGAIKNNFRVMPYIGFATAYSDDPSIAVPWSLSEDYGSWQQGIGVEWLHCFKTINVGLGASFCYRHSYNWELSSMNTSSNKIYSIIEFSNNQERKLISFDAQAGIMEGSLSNKYAFFIGGGVLFNILKQYHKINFSIYPFIEYHGGESKDAITSDCRYNPPGSSCPEIPYTLQFRSINYNLALVVQYNLFEKK